MDKYILFVLATLLSAFTSLSISASEADVQQPTEENTNEIKEFTAYQIVNANGRGKLYYSPDYSSEFVWSTGKNETNTNEENYQWVFVKANDPSSDNTYYLYNK